MFHKSPWGKAIKYQQTCYWLKTAKQTDIQIVLKSNWLMIIGISTRNLRRIHRTERRTDIHEVILWDNQNFWSLSHLSAEYISFTLYYMSNVRT